MTTLNKTPHEPSDDCEGNHCHIHHIDESGEGIYLGCGECGHAYPTRWHLLWAYWRICWQMGDWWHWAWRIRPSKIYFCQECMHDF